MTDVMTKILHEIQQRVFRKFARAVILEKVVQGQLGPCLRAGVSSDFQAGYLEALRWSLSEAGYPASAQMIAARAMVEGWIIASPPKTEDAA